MLISWRAEMGLTRDPLDLSDSVNRNGYRSRLDETLLAQTPVFESAFTCKWGKDHPKVCRQPQPNGCIAHALDGHVKGRRSCCLNKWARVVERPGIGINVLNCPRTPMLGSKFCRECRDACADAGIGSLVAIASKKESKAAAAAAELAAQESGPAREHEFDMQQRKDAIAESMLQ